ncbi:MAG: DUF2335 domain-containing protein [Myxococcota bacterium]
MTRNKIVRPPQPHARQVAMPQLSGLSGLSVQVEHRLEQRSGPLPDPEALARYGEVVPNGAERIMALAERQASHRMDLERIALGGHLAASKWGQVFALVISLAALGSSVAIAFSTRDWKLAALPLSLSLLGVARAFVVGRESKPRANPSR